MNKRRPTQIYRSGETSPYGGKPLEQSMTSIRYIKPRRRSWLMLTLTKLVAAFISIIAIASLTAVAFSSDDMGATSTPRGSFYAADADTIAGKPGTVIRSEPMPFSPDGANAHRILYRSTGLHGETIAVSGVLVVPKVGSNGDRPIVAWAHPTTGVTTGCAPSLRGSVYRQIQGMKDMLADGFAVVATDYPGLGGPGVHPYLIGDSEGRAVLDSVRAAGHLLGEQASPKFAVWGHSQGGQAALYTGLLAERYAPDLDLVGVAAAAPATDLPTLMRDDFSTSGGKGIAALTLWSWSRIFDIPLAPLVEPSAMPTMDRLADGCIESIFDLLERRMEERPLDRSFLSVSDLSKVEPWNRLLAQNSPGPVPSKYPVLIAQGLKDNVVRPDVTFAYVRRLCANGNPVDLLTLPNVGHGFIAHDVATEVTDWLADRFAGQQAQNNCSAAIVDTAAPIRSD